MNDEINNLLNFAKRDSNEEKLLMEKYKEEANQNLKKVYFDLYQKIVSNFQINRAIEKYDDLQIGLTLYAPLVVTEKFPNFVPADSLEMARKLLDGHNAYYYIREQSYGTFKLINLTDLIQITVNDGFNYHYDVDNDLVLTVTFSIPYATLEQKVNNSYRKSR